MQPAQSGMQQLKARMRETWMAGDFGQIARYSAKAAEEFVDRLDIQTGMRVLDVACGTGNLAIPAARKGAVVTGVDIASNLLEQARQRAAAERLNATFEEGDAEELRFAEGEFDVVMTMFGAMFAPRPERVAQELTRVCSKGGAVAMANWTPDGLAGKMFAIANKYIPPREGIPAPVLWGKEDIVRERLNPYISDVKMARRMLAFDFPFPPREVVQFFRKYFGPTQVAFSRMPAEQQTAYADDLEQLWSEHNGGGDDRTFVRHEYLEVIATR